MNSRSLKRLLSILVCLTMVMTQMVPLSFADTAASDEGTSVVTEEQADDAGDAAELSSDDDGQDAESSVSDESTAANEAAVQEDTGEGDQEPETPAAEDIDPQLSWYTKDKNAKEFTITNAQQMFGLAKLVNGVAQEKIKDESTGEITESTTKLKELFSGKTIKLADDIDLSEVTDEQWIRIGYNTSYSFKGTFDGCGHTISGLVIKDVAADTSTVYAGLFGYLSAAVVKDFDLKGEVALTVEGTKRGTANKDVYIGPVAAYARDSSVVSGINVDMDYTGECVDRYLYAGGVVGYTLGTTTKAAYIRDCTVKGSYAMDTVAYIPSTVNTTFYNVVGGIAGYADYTEIENCTSDLDITSYARSIGGIAGYMRNPSSKILNCVNNGDLKSLGESGDDYIGGIAGYYTYNDTKNENKEKTFVNIVNNGNIQATSEWYVRSSAQYANFYAGGAFGYVDKANAVNILNTGNVVIPDNSDEAKIQAAGIIGAQVNTSLENSVNVGKTVYKSYAAGEEDSISRITNIGTSAAGKSIVKNCFVSASLSDTSDAVGMAEDENAEVTSIGVIKKNNAVEEYSSDWPLLYNAKKLGPALNAYVIKNGNSSLNTWVLDSGVYQPVGDTVDKPALPTSKISVKTSGDTEFAEVSEASDTAGNNIVLKAEISVNRNSAGDSELAYQWYSSETPGVAGAKALTGENASGVINDISGEVTYTVTSDEYSQLYYFVRVTNTVKYKDAESGDIVAEESADRDSAKTLLTFMKDTTGFNGETAEKFESGDGSLVSPYIIADASQLKLMEVKINSGETEFTSAYYKLANDIDYRNVKWTPAGGTSSAAAFKGHFDGAGYTIKNLKIMEDGNTAGLFSFISGSAVIENVTVTGSMYAANTKYAGGIVGYAAGAPVLRDLTNGMNINTDNVQNVGGVIGWTAGGLYNAAEIYDCVNAGDIYTTADPSATAIYGTSVIGYTAGVLGYGTTFPLLYNCENTGDITSAKLSGASGAANLYASGVLCIGSTVGMGINDVNYGKVITIGSAADNSSAPVHTGGGTADIQSFDMSTGNIDASAAAKEMNDYTISRIGQMYGKGRMWVLENGMIYPHGPRLEAPDAPTAGISVKVGDGEFIRTNEAVNASCSETVTLKAEINTEPAETGESTVTYQWYKMQSAEGAGKTALTGAGASGTLEGMGGTVEYTVSSDSYSDAYYMIEVTHNLSYAEAGADVVLSEASEPAYVNIVFRKGDGSYEGQVSEALAGKGTAEEPYLITSAADLKLMQQNINENVAGYNTANYKLTASIDFNNIKLEPIGNKTVAFKGTFDGGNNKITNVKLSTLKTGSYGFTGLFGYIEGATVKDLTVEGSMEADGTSQYTGSIAGWADSNSKILNCTANVDMSLEKTSASTSTSYTGGLVGYMVKSSIENSANLGDITVTSNSSGQGKIGGIVGALSGNITSNGAKPASWAADKSIYNSYNSGNIRIVTANESSTKAFNIGGIAAEITTAAVVNSANTGNITSVGYNGVSGAHNIGGIAYSLSNSSSGAVTVRNCASFGDIKADTSNVNIFTGIAVVPDKGYSKGTEVVYIYAPDTYGIDKVFGITTKTASYTPTQTGIGYIDSKTGNITNISMFNSVVTETSASEYIRTEGVRKVLNGEGKTDAYYALNAWTGMNTTDSEPYNSWTAAAGKAGAYIPAGEAKASPFASDSAAVTLTINGDVYKDKTFEPGTELPEMTATLSGAAEGTTYTYSWYKSKAADGSDRVLIADAANSLTYTPKTDAGKYYYSVEAAAVNGEYFKTVSSNYVGVTTKSDSWIGEAASVNELTGLGTAADPYIIDTPEKLALISSEYDTTGTYYSTAPTINGQKGTAFKTAYFKVTKDLDMGGEYAFKCIGSSSKTFQGHLYGEKAEDGTVPVIKNLYMNAPVTSSSYAGLFASIASGGSVENITFENVKLEITSSGTMNMGVVAGQIAGTASAQSVIRNVTVSGEVKAVASGSGAISMGAIAGNAQNYVLIENCVNNAAVTAESTYSSAVTVITGGIAGKISSSINNCVNNGTVNGMDQNMSTSSSYICGTGGIAGYATKLTSNISITGCKNTADVTGYRNVGGIVGFLNWGKTENCYNTGNVTTKNIPTSAATCANIGGIAGNMTSYQPATPTEINSCYSTGVITDEGAGAAFENKAGLIAGLGGSMKIDSCYALSQGDLDVYHSRTNSGTFAVDASIGDRTALQSTATAAYIGGMFYKLDNSAPVLEWEIPEADRCTLTLASILTSLGDTSAKAYIKADEKTVTSVNVVKGSTADLELMTSMGYKVASLKNGEAEITPVNGVYSVKADAAATLTAELAKTPETVAFFADYNGTGDGQRMLVYRNSDGIGEGNGVFFGNVQLIHASAFDSADFKETTPGFVEKSGTLETPADTYVAFVDENTSLSDIVITLKKADAAAVDYSDCDVLGDGDVDVFDAQLIWDLWRGKDGVKATDMQRMHADLNHNGEIDIQDLGIVYDYILRNAKGGAESAVEALMNMLA